MFPEITWQVEGLIITNKGLMPAEALRLVCGVVDDDNENTPWAEYYDGDELVKRSAYVRLKVGVEAAGAIATFGG